MLSTFREATSDPMPIDVGGERKATTLLRCCPFFQQMIPLLRSVVSVYKASNLFPPYGVQRQCNSDSENAKRPSPDRDLP